MAESNGKGRGRSQEEWRRLLSRQAESGADVVAFCRSESISVGSFYRWRRRLSGEGGTEIRSAGGEPHAAILDRGALGCGGGRWELELALGGGLVLRRKRYLIGVLSRRAGTWTMAAQSQGCWTNSCGG